MTSHLKENNTSYFNHMKYALAYSKESAKAMCYFAVHAFFPNVYVFNGSRKIEYLNLLIKSRKKWKFQENN